MNKQVLESQKKNEIQGARCIWLIAIVSFAFLTVFNVWFHRKFGFEVLSHYENILFFIVFLFGVVLEVCLRFIWRNILRSIPDER